MKKRFLVKLLLLSMLVMPTAACGNAANTAGTAETDATASASETKEEAEDASGTEAESAEGEEPSEAATSLALANPWVPTTENEAAEIMPYLFRAPEGATNISWTMMRDTSDPSVEYPETTVQLQFDLDGLKMTAREQYFGESDNEDISGMHYQWTISEDVTLANWAGGEMKGKIFRYIGDGGYADLCTWKDVETGAVYSLGVTAEDLDGFDIQAIAEAMYDPAKEITE